MDDNTIRLLVIIAILIGIMIRTIIPYLRKKKLTVIIFDTDYLATAGAAFLSSWFFLLIMIPVNEPLYLQLIIGVLAGYGGNELVNEVYKWKEMFDIRDH